MPQDHPDQLVGFVRRTQIVMKTEQYRNKEDAHGGPGYYPKETVIAQLEEQVDPGNLTMHVAAKKRDR